MLFKSSLYWRNFPTPSPHNYGTKLCTPITGNSSVLVPLHLWVYRYCIIIICHRPYMSSMLVLVINIHSFLVYLNSEMMISQPVNSIVIYLFWRYINNKWSIIKPDIYITSINIGSIYNVDNGWVNVWSFNKFFAFKTLLSCATYSNVYFKILIWKYCKSFT